MKKFQELAIIPENVSARRSKQNIVDLPDKVLDFIYDNCRRSDKLFRRNYRWMIDNMPTGIEGKLPRGVRPLDFMECEDLTIPGITAVISQRVVDVFKRLHISEEEYDLKEISIEKNPGRFYLLFIPKVLDEEIIFPKSVFFYDNPYGTTDYFKFADYKEYDKKHRELISLLPLEITLPASFEQREIISLDCCGIYISNRIIHELNKEEITGYKIFSPKEQNTPELRFDRDLGKNRILDWFKSGKA